MAASKSYFATSNYRFLPADHQAYVAADAMIFELDESDVWNSSAAAVDAQSPEVRKTGGSRIVRKPASRIVGTAASLPVNVPDWSKILKSEYRENRRDGSDDAADEEGEDEEEEYRIPPHVFLARSRTAAPASVQEGIGRTLKGRDLSRVRNAIWQKTGFED